MSTKYLNTADAYALAPLPGAAVTAETATGGVTGPGAAPGGPWPPFTAPATDDVAKLFVATMPPNFRTGAAEYSTDAGATWTAVPESMRSGAQVRVPVAGAKAAGTVQLRIRADDGRPASAAVSNPQPFTVTATDVVLQENDPSLRRSNPFITVTGAAPGTFYGTAYAVNANKGQPGEWLEVDIPAGIVALSLQGRVDSGGSFFRLDRNGVSVYTDDQYEPTPGRREYLRNLPAARLAVTPGDVVRFTCTNSTFTDTGGDVNVDNFFDQLTLHAS